MVRWLRLSIGTESLSYNQVCDSSLAMVSFPIDIENEWRMVVADRKVITGSQYRKDREIEISGDVDKEVVEFAEKVLQIEWQPHPIFIMDVCKTSSGEYKVVEIGSVNAAGLYDCDIEKILDNTNEIAIREWESVYKD